MHSEFECVKHKTVFSMFTFSGHIEATMRSVELCRCFSAVTSREMDHNGSTHITKHAIPSAA
jgi:hypothetical protein